jgi:molybdopterin molybdotransferase
MTTVEEHARHIAVLLTTALRAGDRVEELPLLDALGRVTAEEVRSPVDLPLFRNSQMDGYAVHSGDTLTVPVELPVVGDIPAGPASPPPLLRGTVARIMTGAVVPEGADSIVPVEDTSTADGLVTIERGRASGEYVRDRASDLRADDVLLPAGRLLAARHLAALAAAGITTVTVRGRVRIAVLSTGSELIAPGDAPAPGQIFDSNLVALSAAVREAGAELVSARRSDDDVETFRGLFTAAIAAADLVITSGGISEGAYEVVREVLEPLGASVGHVAMQPGGPQATAVVDGVPVLCFPGNPVSTQVSFAVFARPLLLAAAGHTEGSVVEHPLSADIVSVPKKRQFLRGRLTEDGSVELVSQPSSHLVAHMARAEVLIDVPAEVTELSAGDPVRVWTL